MKKICKDPTGQEFPSFAAMARAWHSPTWRLRHRLRNGWPLEQALSVPSGIHGDGVRDHLGKWHRSEKAMARVWGINYAVFQYRKSRGWPLKKALTSPSRAKTRRVSDFRGMGMEDVRQLAAAIGMTPHAVYLRLWRGASPAEVACPRSLRCIPSRDHTGRDFPSFSAMARAWGLTPSMLQGRLERGLLMEQALTLPRMPRGRKRKGAAHD